MFSQNYSTLHKLLDSDLYTPVMLYMRLRSYYKEPVLLECNEFKDSESRFSIIGLEPLHRFKAQNGRITIDDVPYGGACTSAFQEFMERINPLSKSSLPFNGVIGFTSYDAIPLFETISFQTDKQGLDLPQIYYVFYRYYLVFDHFHERLHLIEHLDEKSSSSMDTLLQRIQLDVEYDYPFSIRGEEVSDMNDEVFEQKVQKGIEHCKIGDVFQVVFSRSYQQSYRGDEFQLYRKIRSINPSPYLFYFDFGDFIALGSSPEAQISVRDDVFRLNPIAGTFRRSGDAEEDNQRAQALEKDEKKPPNTLCSWIWHEMI